jgi:hypothetical protein
MNLKTVVHQTRKRNKEKRKKGEGRQERLAIKL